MSYLMNALYYPFAELCARNGTQSNFATLDESTGVIVSRRADRHFEEEGPILCAALDGMKLPSFPEYEVRVRCTTYSSRALVCYCSVAITITDTSFLQVRY
jgi:2,3-bisphosphoglycerate-independent phosphoglycerate mutase